MNGPVPDQKQLLRKKHILHPLEASSPARVPLRAARTFFPVPHCPIDFIPGGLGGLLSRISGENISSKHSGPLVNAFYVIFQR